MGGNDTSIPQQKLFNAMAAVSTHLSRITLNNGQVSSYIYIYIYIYSFILNVDATHCPLKLLLLLDFYHCIADVEGTINDDSHDIFMGDYLFVNIATEKSIRRYGGRFNGIVNRAYFLFPKV